MTRPLPPKLLTPSEVAQYFSVDPKTVTRWAAAGKLPYVRTLGGHRRFPEALIVQLASLHNDVRPMVEV